MNFKMYESFADKFEYVNNGKPYTQGYLESQIRAYKANVVGEADIEDLYVVSLTNGYKYLTINVVKGLNEAKECALKFITDRE